MRFKTPVQGAIYAAKMGLKVFPLRRNSKRPAIKGWQTWATCDLSRIKAFAEKHPGGNWGCHCADMVVVDLDVKDGRNGVISWQELRGELKDPRTLTIKTPTSGKHKYFSGPNLGNPTAVRPGLDVRSKGGYVVLFGSRIGGKEYVIIQNSPIAKAPSWLKSAIRERSKRAAQDPVLEEGKELDPGERNAKLFSFGARMRSAGSPESTIRMALMDLNDNHTGQPLATWEIERIVGNVAKLAPGQALLTAEFGKDFTKEELSVPVEVLKIGTSLAREWLMHGRYAPGFISLVTANGGTGKSMLTMLDAVSLVTGKAYTGNKVVQRGNVWYYNTEDPMDEIHRRLDAIAQHYRIKQSEMKGLRVTSGRDKPLILARDKKMGVEVDDSLTDMIVKHIKKHKIKLWIIDPFIGLHQVDENSNSAMHEVMMVLQRIIVWTNCSIGLVHHNRKSGRLDSIAGNPDAARGAKAVSDAARIIHTFTTMTETDAEKYGIRANQHRWYVRLAEAKMNLCAPGGHEGWFQKISVLLKNGDNVGVVSTVELNAPKMTEADRGRVLAEELERAGMNPGDYIPTREALGILQSSPVCRQILGDVRLKTLTARLKDYFCVPIETGDLLFFWGKSGKDTRKVIHCEAKKK